MIAIKILEKIKINKYYICKNYLNLSHHSQLCHFEANYLLQCCYRNIWIVTS